MVSKADRYTQGTGSALRLVNGYPLKPGGYGLGRGAHLPSSGGGELLAGSSKPELEGHGEGLRRNRGDAAGVKPGASSADRMAVNVGTARVRPRGRPGQGRVAG